MSMVKRPFDPARGGWIPWVFVGMMAIVIGVNGILIYSAISTFTGVTRPRTYDLGRSYNAVIAEADRQAALGWSGRVALASGRLSVTVIDREGLPVPGHLTGLLHRPLDGREVPLAFGAAAPGRWTAEATPPAPGQWEARLTLTDPTGQHFDIRQRVIAP
ncbi:FixH family protein [Humitalea sp. 24SJ18S-53]|uniref:FixH family protein n=1 Tax=Humitalea sp. 24SJ18S-53 TaxID=3422307 RepID=UPI003D67D936